MGDSLLRYLTMKVHPLVDSEQWDRLVVVGKHDRSPASVVSTREKKDKPFNWMRPTARMHGRDLHIQAFPGADHVEHYAALLSTYLQLTRSTSEKRPVLYSPVTSEQAQRALEEETNLLRMPQVDTVVTGLVHRLEPLAGHHSRFIGAPHDEFAWTVHENPVTKRTTAFLGCRFSFWGSLAGDMVRVLAKHQKTQRVVYFGKLGTTDPSIHPNRFLASGEYSDVGGHPVRWDNILQDAIASYKGPLIVGRHETLPSVLFETKEWLARAKAKNHLFVDPEVGCMAAAANEGGIGFGYLHVISDNVAKKCEEDLSNEREPGVLSGRERLYGEVNTILRRYLESL